jgi:hypothetical protein
MNRYFTCISLGLALLMAASPGYAKDPGGVSVRSVSSGDTFILDDKTLKDLKRKADHGDSDAAYKVSLHYDASLRHDLAFEWLYLSASQNNPLGQLGMGVINASEGPYKNIPLAKFWLREAAKDKATKELAESELRLLEEGEEAEKTK